MTPLLDKCKQPVFAINSVSRGTVQKFDAEATIHLAKMIIIFFNFNLISKWGSIRWGWVAGVFVSKDCHA